MIQGISVADNSVSYTGDGGAPDGAGRCDPEGSRRDSLTSYVGIDGTNTTLNNGRFLINLQGARRSFAHRASRSPGACRTKSADVSGIKLYLQPEQDLTLDTTVSPNQYQFVLRGPSQQAFAAIRAAS